MFPPVAADSGTDDERDDTADAEPKQTVSIKTITVPGIHGVLENPEDVNPYLEVLRSALLSTLNDGKRIAL